MALKLYELTESYNNLWELINDDTTDNESLEIALKTVEGDIQKKAANIAKFIKQLDYDIDTLKAEEKRLAERRKAIKNRQKHIKQYIQSQMEKMGVKKVQTPTFTIAVQNNPPSLKVEDQNKIPSKFLTIIPQEYKPDKKAILKAIKDGEEVPGCSINQGQSLRIR